MRSENTAFTHVAQHPLEDLFEAIERVGDQITVEDPKAPFRMAGLDLMEVVQVLAAAGIPSADRLRAATGVPMGWQLARITRPEGEPPASSLPQRMPLKALHRAVRQMDASLTDDQELAPPFVAVGLDPDETFLALNATGAACKEDEQVAVSAGIILGLHLADVAGQMGIG